MYFACRIGIAWSRKADKVQKKFWHGPLLSVQCRVVLGKTLETREDYAYEVIVHLPQIELITDFNSTWLTLVYVFFLQSFYKGLEHRDRVRGTSFQTFPFQVFEVVQSRLQYRDKENLIFFEVILQAFTIINIIFRFLLIYIYCHR